MDGSEVGKPCVFPFTYKGKTYNGCPVDPEDPARTRWCSTKTDEQGNHIVGNSGHCMSNCPIDDQGSVPGKPDY